MQFVAARGSVIVVSHEPMPLIARQVSMQPITLHFNEPLLRRAVFAFWWRTTGWAFWICVLAIFVGLCVAISMGDRSWWIGAGGAGLGLMLAAAAMVYVVHIRGSLAKFRRMQKPTGTMELDEEKFRVSSDIGMSEMPWSTVTEIWQYPEFWLVFLSRSQFFTLPTADIDEGSRNFIVERVGAAGGKIVRG